MKSPFSFSLMGANTTKMHLPETLKTQGLVNGQQSESFRPNGTTNSLSAEPTGGNNRRPEKAPSSGWRPSTVKSVPTAHWSRFDRGGRGENGTPNPGHAGALPPLRTSRVKRRSDGDARGPSPSIPSTANQLRRRIERLNPVAFRGRNYAPNFRVRSRCPRSKDALPTVKGIERKNMAVFIFPRGGEQQENGPVKIL